MTWRSTGRITPRHLLLRKSGQVLIRRTMESIGYVRKGQDGWWYGYDCQGVEVGPWLYRIDAIDEIEAHWHELQGATP